MFFLPFRHHTELSEEETKTQSALLVLWCVSFILPTCGVKFHFLSAEEKKNL